MTSGEPTLPSATLAVLAYNQADLVRPTIEAAFAQEGDPIEIILSDDCSTDETFVIMREMARGYAGPHSVRTHRPPANLGLVNHLITLARMAQGELLIVNAGDDISYPHRVATIRRAFAEHGADCVSSRYDEIDPAGNIVRRDQGFPPNRSIQRLFADSRMARKVDGMVCSANGFAAAYRTAFWAELPFSENKLMIEDGLATILINTQGGLIHRHPEPLIQYRVGLESLSGRAEQPQSLEHLRREEEKLARTARRQLENLEYTIMVLRDRVATEEALRVILALRNNTAYSAMVSQFWDVPFIRRLGFLFASSYPPHRKFALYRLFGLRALYVAKSRKPKK